MRPLETSLCRIKEFRIFSWSRRRKLVPSAWWPQENQFLDLTKDEFWACQEAENDF